MIDNLICEVLFKIYESNIDILKKVQQMDERLVKVFDGGNKNFQALGHNDENTYNKLKEIESLIKQIKDKKEDE